MALPEPTTEQKLRSVFLHFSKNTDMASNQKLLSFNQIQANDESMSLQQYLQFERTFLSKVVATEKAKAVGLYKKSKGSSKELPFEGFQACVRSIASEFFKTEVAALRKQVAEEQAQEADVSKGDMSEASKQMEIILGHFDAGTILEHFLEAVLGFDGTLEEIGQLYGLQIEDYRHKQKLL